MTHSNTVKFPHFSGHLFQQQVCNFNTFNPQVLKKNLYEVLGVPKDASQKEIKSAYLQKAKKLHPDVKENDSTSAQKFTEIAEAYEILGDEGKRRHYDALSGVRPGGPGSWDEAPPWRADPRQRRSHMRARGSQARTPGGGRRYQDFDPEYNDPFEEWRRNVWRQEYYRRARERGDPNAAEDQARRGGKAPDHFEEFLRRQKMRDDTHRNMYGGGFNNEWSRRSHVNAPVNLFSVMLRWTIFFILFSMLLGGGGGAGGY